MSEAKNRLMLVFAAGQDQLKSGYFHLWLGWSVTSGYTGFPLWQIETTPPASSESSREIHLNFRDHLQTSHVI